MIGSCRRATSLSVWLSNWAPGSSRTRAFQRPTPSRGFAPRKVKKTIAEHEKALPVSELDCYLLPRLDGKQCKQKFRGHLGSLSHLEHTTLSSRYSSAIVCTGSEIGEIWFFFWQNYQSFRKKRSKTGRWHILIAVLRGEQPPNKIHNQAIKHIREVSWSRGSDWSSFKSACENSNC